MVLRGGRGVDSVEIFVVRKKMFRIDFYVEKVHRFSRIDIILRSILWARGEVEGFKLKRTFLSVADQAGLV